jgi:hypothetical protein
MKFLIFNVILIIFFQLYALINNSYFILNSIYFALFVKKNIFRSIFRVIVNTLVPIDVL